MPPSPEEFSEEAPAIRGASWPRQEPASQAPDAAAEQWGQMATACGPRSEEGTRPNNAREPRGGVFLELWRLPVLLGEGEKQNGS